MKQLSYVARIFMIITFSVLFYIFMEVLIRFYLYRFGEFKPNKKDTYLDNLPIY